MEENNEKEKKKQVIKRFEWNSKYTWNIWPNDDDRCVWTFRSDELNIPIIVFDHKWSLLTFCFQIVESGRLGSVLDGLTIKIEEDEIYLYSYIFDEEFKQQGLISEDKFEIIDNNSDYDLITEIINRFEDEHIFIDRCPLY